MDGEVVVAIVSSGVAGAALVVAIVTAMFARSQTRSAKSSADAAKVQADAAKVQADQVGEQVDIARQAAEAARGQLEAARRQNELQEAMQREQSQPYVVADIRGSEAEGMLWQLVVTNHGATAAHDVRVEFHPPLERRSTGKREPFTALDDGITFLPPGRTMVWHLGTSFSYFDDDEEPADRRVTIHGRGPFGELEPLSYTFSLRELGRLGVSNYGTLTKVVGAIDKLRESGIR